MVDVTYDDTAAQPVLSAAQLARLHSRMTREEITAGTTLFQAGDPGYDFMLIETGEVEIVATTPDGSEEIVALHGPGRFLGELNMLTGQAAYLTARMRSTGAVWRLPPDGFRALMAEDGELSDIILRAFMERREILRTGSGARSIEILGSRLCSVCHALRTWAARQRLPHTWVDIDEPGGEALARAINADTHDIPVVWTPTRTLRNATAGDVAELLGLSYQPVEGKVYDVVVVGGGPAGLAAAVYGASEGLETMLLDAAAVGGQAAASSRIENYLGFPSGLSGARLMDSGLVQAQKFGAHVATPCRVTDMQIDADQLRLSLSDGTQVPTRAVIIASGASYRTLPLARWDDFEGAGIYFAATEIEARECGPNPVTVVGGANSAGQAAIYLAERGSNVTLVVRGADIDNGMSRYLVDRVEANPKITIHTNTQVTGLGGDRALESISVTENASAATNELECHGLFCFIGAKPATGWLDGPALDSDGFVLTDQQLDADALGPTWALLDRRPLPFETSVPNVFAAGDVRHGSMKRVAAAVGEGASAIRSVHEAIGGVH